MVDRKIAALSRRQRGFVTARQLRLLGLGRDAIRYRIRVGRLIRVYHGVYSVGHLPSSPVDFAAAAVLAGGRGAALSHASAAALWGWRQEWKRPFHVTAPSNHKRDGIVFHHLRLAGSDVARIEGIRVTSPARTLLDVAPILPSKQLRRAVREAQLVQRLDLGELADVLARFSRHPGARLLLPLVSESTGPTRSELEDAFLDFCRHFDLPRPEVNTRVAGYEVDAFFPDHRLAVELDGWWFHRTRDSFESDRDKDADLLLAGIETVRITWQRLTGRSRREAERLRAILNRRRQDRAA
jgi:very-short-patch-repair endonuclease